MVLNGQSLHTAHIVPRVRSTVFIIEHHAQVLSQALCVINGAQWTVSHTAHIITCPEYRTTALSQH